MTIKLNIESFFSQHQGELINHVKRIVQCPETAEEIAQESYMVLAQTLKTRPVEYPRGFLYRVARNLALDKLRHQKVEQQYAVKFGSHDAPEAPSAEHAVAQQQRNTLIRQIIDELPPRCREVFFLHKIQGYSYSEIADELGISKSCVEKHVMKGLNHCRRRLLQASAREKS